MSFASLVVFGMPQDLAKSLGLLIHKRVSDGLDLHLRYEHGNILRMYLTDTTRTDNTYFHGCSSLK